MSKLFLTVVILASAALFDPPRALALIRCEQMSFASSLRQFLAFDRLAPRLAHIAGY